MQRRTQCFVDQFGSDDVDPMQVIVKIVKKNTKMNWNLIKKIKLGERVDTDRLRGSAGGVPGLQPIQEPHGLADVQGTVARTRKLDSWSDLLPFIRSKLLRESLNGRLDVGEVPRESRADEFRRLFKPFPLRCRQSDESATKVFCVGCKWVK